MEKKEAFGIEYQIVRYEVRCLHLVDGKVKLLIEEYEQRPSKVGSAETTHVVYRCGKCGRDITDGYVDHAFFCSKRYAVIDAAVAMYDGSDGGIGDLKRAAQALIRSK